MSNTILQKPSHPYYVCPACGAYTVEGHDDDMQINCANCGHSFIMNLAKCVEIADEEIEQEYVRRVNSAHWAAYVKREKG